jgi:tRNA nucleotidyltransferase (CCA-adding enzyme)
MTASIAAALAAQPRLRTIADVVAGRPHDSDVFVVGGTVRDILLGEQGADVDLAVEGDAIAFAYELADALGGRATPHRKFGTAVVLDAEGERIDVVPTRSESYHAPGALPTVEHADLANDLHRRDFTINAMAASLEPDDLGALFDPYDGRSDLEHGVVRVLHDASFVDDPTRILRGIRYEARYGFRFDEKTETLLKACVDSGVVRDFASSRLRDELVELLEDEGARDGIRRLGELHADAAIHPHLRADDHAATLFQRAISLRDELATEIPTWRIGLAVLARELSSAEAEDWLERLKIRRREADHVIAAIAAAPRIVQRLRSAAADPSQVFAVADPFAPDAPLLALAAEDRPELRDYFLRARHVRLAVTGADLLAMGLEESPRVGEILAEVRRRKLNGALAGREAELALARELVAASLVA